MAKLSESQRTALRNGRDAIKSSLLKLAYFGNARYCPVCGKTARSFLRYGVRRRPDAACVYCGALERHRFVWLYFTQLTDLFDGAQKRVLHVAPERCFEPILRRRLGCNYLTADLFNPSAMVKMDVTNIQFPDESFDVIYCSHVLEHVQNDRQALKEFRRVLKKSGWAILLVPVTADFTFEDPLIVDPEDRIKVFGQRDHVRQYGADYVDRLRDVGFKVRVTKVADMVNTDDAIRMGLTAATGDIYYCTR